jgi:hypothetical protein
VDKPGKERLGKGLRRNLPSRMRALRQKLKLAETSLRNAWGLLEECMDEADALQMAVNESGEGEPTMHGFGDPIAYEFEMEHRADGSIIFHLGNAGSVPLPPKLAQFFIFLASEKGSSEDGLVPWKPRAEIRRWLEVQSGRAPRKGYENKLVGDLREKLDAAGMDEKLIQTHLQKGVRVALRARMARGAGGVSG